MRKPYQLPGWIKNSSYYSAPDGDRTHDLPPPFFIFPLRTPGSGLYDNLKQYNIPTPQDIFDIDFFDTNPRPFFELARELYPGRYHPNLVHFFLRLLYEKGVLRRIYTQNIDGLELGECHVTHLTGFYRDNKARHHEENPRLIKCNDNMCVFT